MDVELPQPASQAWPELRKKRRKRAQGTEAAEAACSEALRLKLDFRRKSPESRRRITS